MRRVTVRWNVDAESDLAKLWMLSPDRGSIEAAANEIDVLLSIGPATKGRPFALAMLDIATIELIEARAIELPEDLRWLRCGPLEVFFRALEEDAMAIVLHVRPRRKS